MDSGNWTLRCQNCNATFELELNEREQIADYARGHPCPECRNTPAGSPAANAPDNTGWHRVIGFRAPAKGNSH